MSINSADIVNKLSEHQPQIWQCVSSAVSEAANASIKFVDPLTVSAKTSDLFTEFGSPMLVMHFTFADLPENPQVILLPQETFIGLAEEISEDPIAEIDDQLVESLRPVFEALAQGICVGASNIRGEALVPINLAVRFQLVSFPSNIQKSIEIFRTQVGITGSEHTGTATWLCDDETLHHMFGAKSADQAEAAFPQLVEGGQSQAGRSTGDDGLNLLMDIPLEVSVELGRVKMLVKDVIELGIGSIVEIDKAAGEPVDVMLNGRLVARGEVVVIEDNFGVRLTEILNPQERLHRLGEVA